MLESGEIAGGTADGFRGCGGIEGARLPGVRENTPVRDRSGTLRHSTPARHSPQRYDQNLKREAYGLEPEGALDFDMD